MQKSILKPLGICLLVFFITACSQSQTKNTNMEKQEKTIPETITFNSIDGLTITANLYFADTKYPFIVLCHQARYNKSEYSEAALTLNKNGFNCLAVDLRSGGPMENTKNETNLLAVKKMLPVDYLDAEQDIVAAVNYIAQKYNQKVILLGSSYSASLSLKVAKENENVKAVIAFSPGEYFGNKLNLADTIKGLNKPVFVTSSRLESSAAKSVLKYVTSEIKEQFIPKGDGVHGASALKKETANNQEYWDALLAFLNKIK